MRIEWMLKKYDVMLQTALVGLRFESLVNMVMEI
jgi:hypothetical protein